MIGSLFAGIGGLELGLEWAGLGPTVWQAEADPWCRSLLRERWPDAKMFNSVQEVRHGRAEKVDVICGGFPCQPVSVAGKGLGADDDRWLWPECIRIMRELEPTWAVWENVPMLRQRGLCGVLRDLAAGGWDAEWIDLRASDVGAPHRRERIFIVCHRDGAALDRFRAAIERAMAERGRFGGVADARGGAPERRRGAGAVAGEERATRIEGGGGDTRLAPAGGGGEDVADGDGDRRVELGASRLHADGALGNDAARRGAGPSYPPRPGDRAGWDRWDGPQPLVRRGADGVPDRAHRLRALGNAVVPGCAALVGRAIVESAH